MNELLQLMHDTMNKTARIKGAISLLKSEQDNGREFDLKLLDIIETSAKELNDVLDAYYISETVCSCNDRRDQYQQGKKWICGDCDKEMKFETKTN